MKTPSSISTILIRLFDYQKYEPSAPLSALCGETEDTYAIPLSDDALSRINAAGDSVTDTPYPQTRCAQDEPDFL